jgi:alkanesulfonate monooxygenase SsuD/methylene tetrahydromethanopterin reductase-like flavin-dependent oxidoreductase (luciferase family)
MEDLGLRRALASEHHFFYDGYCPALLPAALGAVWSPRLRVGTGCCCRRCRTPSAGRVAHDLNDRSGGRPDLGVGMGYRDIEFDGHSISRKQRLRGCCARLEVLEAEQRAGGAAIWMGAQLIDPVKRASTATPSCSRPPSRVERCRTWPASGRRAGASPGAPSRSRRSAPAHIWLTEDARADGRPRLGPRELRAVRRAGLDAARGRRARAGRLRGGDRQGDPGHGGDDDQRVADECVEQLRASSRRWASTTLHSG